MKSIQSSFLTPRYVVTKLTSHWSSSILKRFKYSKCISDFCRVEGISLEFNNENMLIPQKVDNTGYPSPFTNSVIIDLGHKQNKRHGEKDEYIIRPNL